MQIAFIIFFIALFASRFIIMDGLKKLSEEDKVKLMSSRLINQSQLRLILVFALLGVYYVVINKFPQYANQILLGFFVVIFAERLFTFIHTRNKLQSLDMPAFYINKFVVSSLVYNAGLLLFFFLLIKDYL